MTITVNAYSGAPSISTTEYSLPSASTTRTTGLTVAGLFSLMLDMTTLIAGDQLELRIYEKATATSAQVVVDTVVFTGIQDTPGYFYPPILLGNGWDMTLTMLSATARVINFGIREVS